MLRSATQKMIGITVIIIIALIGGALFILGFVGDVARPASMDQDAGQPAVPGWKTYKNFTYGIEFQYPPTYYLEEKEIGTGERSHYTIMLTEDTEENRAVREGRAPGREGPVAITFDIYRNDVDKISLETWLSGTNFSNFKLSDGTYRPVRIADYDGIAYQWSGLYEADNVAFQTPDVIISVFVTYIEPGDAIRADFGRILETIKIAR